MKPQHISWSDELAVLFPRIIWSGFFVSFFILPVSLCPDFYIERCKGYWQQCMDENFRISKIVWSCQCIDKPNKIIYTWAYGHILSWKHGVFQRSEGASLREAPSAFFDTHRRTSSFPLGIIRFNDARLCIPWNDFIHDPQEILLALSSFLRPLHSMSVNVPCFISFIEP